MITDQLHTYWDAMTDFERWRYVCVVIDEAPDGETVWSGGPFDGYCVWWRIRSCDVC